ncbi:MAG: biotin--[acetyl-CoA-carboxylase] ligase [Paracoccaceae bacterium]|uniref:biotin--[acetyl-CoA-carboxylase] ligase n=1 Tax=Rhodobacterales TaxID=204455 RepID=UPI003298CF73
MKKKITLDRPVARFGNPTKITLTSARSTNDEALALLMQGHPTPFIVHAWSQTHGRGKRDRQWLGGPGTLTASWTYSVPQVLPSYEIAGQINLVTALAVSDAIDQSRGAAETLVKWPNDVILNNGKVAGILVELRDEGEDYSVVIGVGVNVSMAPELVDLKRYTLPPSTVFENHFDDNAREPQVDALIKKVTECLHTRMDRFVEERGLGSQYTDVVVRDFIRGQKINFFGPQGSEPSQVLAKGIQKNGQLRVAFHEFHEKDLYSGDVERVVADDFTLSEYQEKVQRRVNLSMDGTVVIGAPVPGYVSRVCVAVGDVVGEGDELMYIEAMKQEFSINATGTMEVTEVLTPEGSAVDVGEMLVIGSEM